MSNPAPTLPPVPSTIANLPQGTSPLSGNESVPISQNGLTVKISANQFSVVGPTGPTGATGATGPQGPAGPPGAGSIAPGTTGQIGFYASSGTGLSPLTVSTGLSITGSTLTAPAQNLTGDVTSAGVATTLATVNSNVGTFASVTVNGKGLVTAAANLTGDITSSSAATTLATVNSNVGSFTNANITVNAKGLITAASNGTLGTANVYQASPSNPTGTTNGTGVMMGLAGAITPATTGDIMIIICGNFSLNTTGNPFFQIRYGTGSAPSNGAALTGTAVGGKLMGYTTVSNDQEPFSLNAIVTGLTLSTAIWIDLSLGTNAGTGSLFNISISAYEIK